LRWMPQHNLVDMVSSDLQFRKRFKLK
jgi:hypothetical protein